MGGRGSGSGMSRGSQNYELTSDNSGGFTVIDDSDTLKQFVNNNSGWNDSIYDRAFGEGGAGRNDPSVKAIEQYQNSSLNINSRLRNDDLNPSTRTKVNNLTRVLDNAEVDTPFVAHRSSSGKLLGIDGDVSVEK